MKKFFDFNLYKEGLRQTKVMGITLAVIFVLGSALMPVLQMIYAVREQGMIQVSLNEFAPFLSLFMFIGPLLLAMSLFSFTNKRRSSDFYHSIPYTRTNLYISFLASLITWIVSIITLAIAVNTILFLISPTAQIELLFIPYAFFYYLSGALLVLSAVMLAKGISGTGLNNFLVSGLILYFPRFIMLMFSLKLSEMLKIVDMSSMGLFINTQYNIPISNTFSVITMGAGMNISFIGGIIYTFILGAIYIGAGCLLFNKRKSETAERSAPNKLIQHVFRCLITIPITLIITIIVTGNSSGYYVDSGMIIVVVFISLIIYFGYELITTKKVKNLIKAIPVLLIVVLFNIGFGSTLVIARDITLSVTPSSEEISGVNTIFTNNMYGMYSSSMLGYGYTDAPKYNELLLSDFYLDDSKLIQIVSDSLKDTVESIKNDEYELQSGRNQSVNFTIKTKNGSSIKRDILVSSGDYNYIKNTFIRNSEYQEKLTKIPEYKKNSSIAINYVNSNISNTKEIWELYLSEYNELDAKEKAYHNSMDENIPGSMEKSNVYSFEIAFYGYEGVNNFVSNYKISDKTPKTFRKILDAVNNNNMEGFFRTLSKVAEEGSENYNIDIYNYDLYTYNGASAYNPDYIRINKNLDEFKKILTENKGEIDTEKEIYTINIGCYEKNEYKNYSIYKNFTQDELNKIKNLCAEYYDIQPTEKYN